MNKTLEAEVNHNDKVCHNVRGQVEAQMKRLQEQESEIETLKLELGNCRREIKHLEQMKLEVSLANDQLLQSPEKHPNSGQKQDDCDSFSRKDVCQVLQKEISDQEQRKCHERQDRLKLKLRHVKFKLKDEMEWRDEKIGELKRELSLCSHALTLEKELNMDVMMENDKLLIEKRRLVQQLNEEVCLFVQQPETHPHSAPFQAWFSGIGEPRAPKQNSGLVRSKLVYGALATKPPVTESSRGAEDDLSSGKDADSTSFPDMLFAVAGRGLSHLWFAGRCRDVVAELQFGPIWRNGIPQPELLPQPLSPQHHRLTNTL